MKITQKQLQILMVILKDSQKNIYGVFSYDLESRNKLLNDIINQQSNEVIDINNEDNNHEKPT